MKYIRTKDRIEDVPDFYAKKLTETPTLKVTDTIEELCDLYVIVHLNCERTPDIFIEKIPLQRGYKINKDYIIYGAIWTSKGLIYVAKMNEKGELELL